MGIVLIVIMAFIAYLLMSRRNIYKQVEVFNQLLYLDKNPEKYIAEVDKILRKLQSEREKNINLIQKTTGLLYAGRFEESIRILTDDVKKIPPNWQHVFYHNLVLSLFFSDETSRANEILTEVHDVLDEYAKKDYNKTAIEFIYAVADFYNGNGIAQKEFFKNLVEIGRNEYRIAFGYYFLGKIYEIENNIEDSEANLEKARIYGKGSFIEELL